MTRGAIPGLTTIFIVALAACGTTPHEEPPTRVPVIYCTDLFHPHDDPDDHFDIVCMYAIPEFEIEAVILDDGALQDTRSGKVALEQLNRLTGRRVPWAIGLSGKLRSPDDRAEDAPARHQGGVSTILRVLEEAESPVTVITVGSLRDVAAALNRAPELCRRKIGRIMCFIGEAKGGHDEHNVRLDPHAFVRVMNSDLPVFWVPCCDRGVVPGEKHSSFWKASHAELLADAPEPLIAFFAHALLHKTAADPHAALRRPVPDYERARVLEPIRNLWCTAVFTHAAERRFVRRDGRWITVPGDALAPGEETAEIFGFRPVSLVAHDAGEVTYETSGRAHEIMRYVVTRRGGYAEAMTSATRALIRDLGRSIETRDGAGR